MTTPEENCHCEKSNIDSQFSGKNFHVAVDATEVDLNKANSAINHLINSKFNSSLDRKIVSTLLQCGALEDLGTIVSKAFMTSTEEFDYLCDLLSDVDAECDGKYFKGVPAKEFLEGVAIEYKRQAIERDMGI